MSSPITGGVRQIGCWLSVGGANIPVLSATVTQSATVTSSWFSAQVPLDGQSVNESFWANTSPINATIYVSTQPGGGDRTTLIMGGIDFVTVDEDLRVVQVRGRDISSSLHTTKSAEKFTNQKSSDIISTLASRVGLTVSAATTSLFAGKIFQIDFAKMTDGVSYASIFHKLAEFEGAKWFVKGNTLNFQVTGQSNSSGSYVVNYSPPGQGPANADFLKLRITREVPLSQTIKVTVNSWNTKKKKRITSTKAVGGTGGTVEYRYRVPELEQSHADKHAQSKANDHARHEISISLQMVGDPTIDISQKLTLRGTAFAQDFDIDEIHHEIGTEGYLMTISAKSAKSGRGSATDSAEPSTSEDETGVPQNAQGFAIGGV